MKLVEHVKALPLQSKLTFIEDALKEARQHVLDKEVEMSLHCAMVCLVDVQVAFNNMRARYGNP